eukprot:TRINITY_DN21498_c0_g1_i1.p1 TRINITY_DN21498_c0_g1~~TRINITY_DN21498_c0_g1_i1.p1  ORF type:complete len:745 (-),score=278.91 TRINITY_DN21498_c0_g1_i1:8-2125(-)
MMARTLEDNYAEGRNGIIVMGYEFDLIKMQRRSLERNTEELVRRRVVWGFKKSNETFSHAMSDEEVYILNYISGITQEKDENLFLNKVLKHKNEDLSNKIQETQDLKDLNLNTWESARSVLRIKENEVMRMRGVVDCYGEVKRELEGRKEEIKVLDALNSDLRLKLSKSLLNLETQMVTSVNETEGLLSKAKTLSLDLQEKDKELSILKPLTPKIGRKSESTATTTKHHRDGPPVSPRSELILPTRLASPRHSTQLSPLRTSTPNPPKSPTSPRAHQPQTSLASLQQEPSTPKGDKPGRLKLTHSSPMIKPLRLNELHPNEGPKESLAEQRQHLELREKLIAAENKLKTKEMELETSRTAMGNLKKELEFIEVMKMQKSSLNDSLNGKIKEGEKLTDTLDMQSKKLIKLERRIRKIKKKYKLEESSSDNEATMQYESELEYEIEDLGNKKEKLKEMQQKQNESNQEVKEMIVGVEKQKAEMENMLAKVNHELKEKEKEIVNLQSPQKEPSSSKMLQVLRKEAMVEKSKVVTLNSNVKQLNEELKMKEGEIEELRSIIRKLSVSSQPFQKNLESDLENIRIEIQKEKEKGNQLELLSMELKQNLGKLSEGAKSVPEKEASREEMEKLNEEVLILKKASEERDQEIERLKNEKTVPKDMRMMKALMEESQKMKTSVLLSTKELDLLKKQVEQKEEQLKTLSLKLEAH